MKYRFITVILMSIVFGAVSEMGGQNEDHIAVFGEIVGFQPAKRCPDCGPVRDGSHRAEKLIFRVNSPAVVAERSEFILIDYAIYHRGITDKEMASGRLEFTLRERPKDWANDCRGTVLVNVNNEPMWRAGEWADYEFLKGASAKGLPAIDSLPCFYGGTPPVDREKK